MIAGNQGYDVEYEGAAQAEPVWQSGAGHSACAKEHRCWVELIGWLEKLGIADTGLQEKADILLRETEEMIRKTELLIAQRGAFASSVKERLYQEH
jgi:hypothetical protein